MAEAAAAAAAADPSALVLASRVLGLGLFFRASSKEGGFASSLLSFFASTAPARALEPRATAPADAGPVKKRAGRTGGPIPAAEVARHVTPGDCWLTVDGKVYDVSGWDGHPGGTVLLTHAGRDASDAFAVFHAPSSRRWLQRFYLGEAAPAAPVAAAEGFRALRAALTEAGLFKPRLRYYALKLATNLAILGACVAVLVTWGDAGGAAGAGAFVVGAALLALFWQQSGWLAHDCLHHQVFGDRRLNNAAGLLTGNVMQGFSAQWWKTKHNTHHAATNAVIESGGGSPAPPSLLALDPDIDTLPLLAWSPELLASLPPAARGVVRHQHRLFFPILLFARLQWASASAQYAVAHGLRWEQLGLAIHYLWVFGLAFATLPWPAALPFVLAAQMACGLLLAIVFVQSHNFMAVLVGTLGAASDFATDQVLTTRNIAGGAVQDWFSGGLNRQIEHHLFPTMPRHNLGRAEPHVRAFCARHGLTYTALGMGEGTAFILRRLKEVAALA